MTSEDLSDAFFDQLYNRRYAEAFAFASRMPLDEGDRTERAKILAMRGAALLGMKRLEDSAKLFAQADALDPSYTYPTSLRYRAALLSNSFEVAADAIDRMIARYPDVARELDWQQLVFFLTNAPKSDKTRNDDRMIALARLGYGADADYGDQVAQAAVKILAKRSDFAGAGELLSYIDEPQALEGLLIQKRFAALWPRLEQEVGPKLNKVRASSVAAAERAYAASPEDALKLTGLIEAYIGAGRMDDAVALRSKLPATAEGFASADQAMGWAINGVAYALSRKGQIDEADQLFAALTEAPREGGAWRIAMKIHRVKRLLFAARFESALPLLEKTAADAQTEGNASAHQTLRSLRYCAYSRIGQKAQAAAIRSEMLSKAKDSFAATIDGLVCTAEIEAAEQVTLAALSDEDFEEEFVSMLQPGMLTRQSSTPWEANWAKLRSRPAIAAAYERLGRDMPKEFLVN